MRRLASCALLMSALAFGQTNLNFQAGQPDGAPPGWFVVGGATDSRFAASWQREGCHGALPCALLSAPPDAPADSFGTMMQSFAAQPFRGQPVRLRAWIRLEKKLPTDHAQMLLHVGRPDFQPAFVDNMANRPIDSEEWDEYEIQGEVAPDADTIQIGISLYGSGRVWIAEVEFGAVAAQTAGPAVDAAREPIRKQYARLDSAFVRGDGNEIAAVLMPGAQMGVGMIREPLLPAIRSEMAKTEKLTARTEVTSLRLEGDESIVMVRREAEDPKSAGTRKVVTSHRDTWIQTPEGWRLRESIEVSYHWVLPPTSAGASRPVVAELKTRAVPMSVANGLAAFGAAVGEARIVALGEAARGTREFAQVKQRMVEYLVAQKGFTELVGDPSDAQMTALADRLHIHLSSYKVDTPEAVANHFWRIFDGDPGAKVIFWTDNAHARDSVLREKFGRQLYTVGFAFDRGEVKAVGVEKGESKGLATYTAQASPEGSGDAVLSSAGIPQFFLNMANLPPGGALARWLGGMHLFHDLGAYWVLDDPDASLQPEELALDYDGLYYVEEVHTGG
jgi:hypothetical protein